MYVVHHVVIVVVNWMPDGRKSSLAVVVSSFAAQCCGVPGCSRIFPVTATVLRWSCDILKLLARIFICEKLFSRSYTHTYCLLLALVATANNVLRLHGTLKELLKKLLLQDSPS